MSYVLLLTCHLQTPAALCHCVLCSVSDTEQQGSAFDSTIVVVIVAATYSQLPFPISFLAWGILYANCFVYEDKHDNNSVRQLFLFSRTIGIIVCYYNCNDDNYAFHVCPCLPRHGLCGLL